MTAQRLGQFIKNKGISYYAFENAIGASRGSISKAVKENKSIGSSILENILNEFADLNPIWLLTGKGKMLKNEDEDLHLLCEDAPAYKSTEGIPLIPIDAMAGVLTENSTAVMDFECDHYIVPMFKGADFLIPVKGDSMQPKYFGGDIVACKRLPFDAFFQWNRTYVIDSDQGVLIKRVRRGKDDQHIMVVSENPDYEPFEIEKSRIHSLALVIGVVRAE